MALGLDFGGPSSNWQGKQHDLEAWAEKNRGAVKVHKDLLKTICLGLWSNKKALHTKCLGRLDELTISSEREEL